MRRNIAVTVLSLVFLMNIGSGYTQKIDHQLSKIESSLCERFDNRLFTEQLLETERKTRARAVCAAKR